MHITEVHRLARQHKSFEDFMSEIDKSFHDIPETVVSDKIYILTDLGKINDLEFRIKELESLLRIERVKASK